MCCVVSCRHGDRGGLFFCMRGSSVSLHHSADQSELCLFTFRPPCQSCGHLSCAARRRWPLPAQECLSGHSGVGWGFWEIPLDCWLMGGTVNRLSFHHEKMENLCAPAFVCPSCPDCQAGHQSEPLSSSTLSLWSAAPPFSTWLCWMSGVWRSSWRTSGLGCVSAWKKTSVLSWPGWNCGAAQASPTGHAGNQTPCHTVPPGSSRSPARTLIRTQHCSAS